MLQKIQDQIKNHHYSRAIILALFIIAGIIIYIEREGVKSIAPATVNIAASKAVQKDAGVYLSGLGTVTPTLTSNIQPQISGQILEVVFNDGQLVKKNDILVEIDPSLYNAQLLQSQGQLETNKSLLANALIDLKRYQDLWKENSISDQTLATQVSLVNQYKGDVKNAQGLVDTANVNLSYCTIRAPFDGLMGIDQITAGSLVNSSSVIAVINSLSPIYVLFTLPESNLQELKKQFKLSTDAKKKMEVDLYDSLKETIIAKGSLLAIDNQINSSTGTIQLKAVFDNQDYKLYPNQFVNAKLLLKTLKDMIIVPVSAIQYDSTGSFVYLIDNNVAKITPVTISHLSEGSAVITSGIANDQIVATTGTDKLTDGALVSITKTQE